MATITAYAGKEWHPLPVKIEPLPHHVAGLSYTASGYGRKIPTTYTVRHNGRRKRVYCCQYGNAGTFYVLNCGEWLIIQTIQTEQE